MVNFDVLTTIALGRDLYICVEYNKINFTQLVIHLNCVLLAILLSTPANYFV